MPPIWVYGDIIYGNLANSKSLTTFGSLHPDNEIRNRVDKAVEKDLHENIGRPAFLLVVNTSEQGRDQEIFRDIPGFLAVFSCLFSTQSFFSGPSLFEKSAFHFGVPG
jgi:hypothetical protein